MLAGTVVSAVMGGLAGLAFAVTQDHGLLQTLLDYPLGGGMAVVAFWVKAQGSILSRA